MTNTICGIFAHRDFIVIDKPVGVPMHDSERGVVTLAQQHFNIDKLYLVHRLDTVTSGCLILAKHAQAAADLSALFAQHRIQKYYLAVTDKKPKKKQGTIAGDMINRRRGQHALLKTKENPAVTQFFSEALTPPLRVCVVKPLTGKTHQIRVALKSVGSPILGDEHYGGTPNDRTYLHAFQLCFTYQNEQIQVSCPPREGEVFQTEAWQTWLAKQGEVSQRAWPSYTHPTTKLQQD